MEQQIQFFDDIDDMFAALDKGVKKANDMTLPRQKLIQYGDYWMRMWEDLIIFGRISTTEELDAEERRLGATEEEIAYEHEAMDYSYSRGFRFGRAYSIVEPTGELGDTHISQMVPITKEEFEDAKRLNWDADAVIASDWFIGAIERLGED
jgi:hypothetical protein